MEKVRHLAVVFLSAGIFLLVLSLFSIVSATLIDYIKKPVKNSSLEIAISFFRSYFGALLVVGFALALLGVILI